MYQTFLWIPILENRFYCLTHREDHRHSRNRLCHFLTMWNEATNKSSFSQRVRRLHEWGLKINLPPIFLKTIQRFRADLDFCKKSYYFSGVHRTSNMLDRLMQRMDLHLLTTQYFHGSLKSSEAGIRAWALILNFAPSNPNTLKKYNTGLKSPAERFNQFSYSESWLQNLMISAFRGGYRVTPQNP